MSDIDQSKNPFLHFLWHATKREETFIGFAFVGNFIGTAERALSCDFYTAATQALITYGVYKFSFANIYSQPSIISEKDLPSFLQKSEEERRAESKHALKEEAQWRKILFPIFLASSVVTGHDVYSAFNVSDFFKAGSLGFASLSTAALSAHTAHFVYKARKLLTLNP